MNILKYTILALTILNLPTVTLFWVSEGLGSLLNYSVYGFLLLYYFLNKGGIPNMWMLIIGISYYSFSGLNFEYGGDPKYYFFFFLKYIIFIICGSKFVENVNKFELLVFLFLGSISIIIHAAFYPDNFGRYSGLYMNPNAATFIAIMGYALTYSLQNKYVKTLVQIICTIAGIITFSRTFIIIWILVNLLSIRISIKNIRVLAIGAALFVALITFGELFKLNTIRLKQFSSVLNNEEGAVAAANDDSRSDTWAQYYDNILEKPIIGNGYGALSGYGIYPTGAHNAFIMVLGEAGIVSFIIFTGLYLYILFCGIKLFDYSPHILMQGIAIFLFLLTFHNYWDNLYILIITLWICNEISISFKKKLNYEKNT